MGVLKRSKMVRWLGCRGTWSLPVLCTVLFVGILQFVDNIKAEETLWVSSSESDPPEITKDVGEAWEIIEETEGSPTSVYSVAGDDLFLRCTAKYPIQWNISGIIAPPEIVKILPPTQDLKKGFYQIRVNIFFLDAENYPDLLASANLACEQVGNAKNRDEISVFVKGSSKNSLIEPRSSILESDEVTLIPCPTSDPKSVKPKLYFKDGQKSKSEVLVQKVIYSPTEGFRYEDGKIFIGGMYICRRGTESVVTSVVDSSMSAAPSAPSDARFAPISSNVSEFSDGFLVFSCFSKSKPVNFVFERSNDLLVTPILDSENSKMVSVSVNDTVISPENPVLSGRAVCLSEGQGVVKEWNWKFVQPPRLYLDNLEGEADCLSDVTPKSVQTVRCKNAMDCQFMGDNCLRNKSLCNFKKQKQFYADTDTYCSVAEKVGGHPCVSVPFSHLNGVVKCKVMELERRWNFFISLDYARYTNADNVKVRELVRIDEISEEEQGNPSSIQYVCTASAYLFADSLAFEIRYKNGSSTLIQDMKPSIDSTHEKYKQIMELNVKAVLDKKMISSDAVWLDCLAPVWNDTTFIKATKYLGSSTKRLAPQLSVLGTSPALIQPQENSHPEELSENFYIGETNKRLNCTTKRGNGQQGPSWIYKDGDGTFKGAKAAYPELNTGTTEDGTRQNYLEFPKVEKKYVGEYICIYFTDGSNIYSNDTTLGNINGAMMLTKYTLDVSAEPLPTSTTVYVGLTILVLVIVCLAIAVFAVFAQKRNH